MKKADKEKPLIFISWSGKHTLSYLVAEKLKKFLPLMFQNADYFFSDHLQKGKFALNEIFTNLSKARYGIFCVTKANVIKPWLNFEAGAIACTVAQNDGNAMPLLIDLSKEEFSVSTTPLSNYQATEFLDEQDMLSMLKDIGIAINSPLSEKQIEDVFNRYKSDLLEINVPTELDNNIGLSIEITNVYKMAAKNGYEYIFKINIYNNTGSVIFIKNISIGKSNSFLNVKSEQLELLKRIHKTNNIETERKVLLSHRIPFKVLNDDFDSGYFNLHDEENIFDLQLNDNIEICVAVGDKTIKFKYNISTLNGWDKIEF